MIEKKRETESFMYLSCDLFNACVQPFSLSNPVPNRKGSGGTAVAQL
jgi:hypothetical protein